MDHYAGIAAVIGAIAALVKAGADLVAAIKGRSSRRE